MNGKAGPRSFSSNNGALVSETELEALIISLGMSLSQRNPSVKRSDEDAETESERDGDAWEGTDPGLSGEGYEKGSEAEFFE